MRNFSTIGIVTLIAVLSGLGAWLAGESAGRRAAHDATATLRDYQMTTCRNAKEDRVNDAILFASQVVYWEGVINAESVQEDVKKIARRVQDAARNAAEGKESRIYLCEPLVYQGDAIPDEDMRGRIPELPPKRP